MIDINVFSIDLEDWLTVLQVTNPLRKKKYFDSISAAQKQGLHSSITSVVASKRFSYEEVLAPGFIRSNTQNKEAELLETGSFWSFKIVEFLKLVSSISGRVLYFSRAEIPFTYNKRPEFYSKHLSIVSFKPESLVKFSEFPKSNLEQIEGIELLRAIENDMLVGTFVIEGNSFAVDVKEDLLKAIEVLPEDEFRKLY